MILKDFECRDCGYLFEEFTPADNEKKLAEGQDWGYKETKCPSCESYAVRPVFNGSSALPCENIIPIYPGCKKHKAGYTHTSHADQKATRYQVGYGGFQGTVD